MLEKKVMPFFFTRKLPSGKESIFVEGYGITNEESMETLALPFVFVSKENADLSLKITTNLYDITSIIENETLFHMKNKFEAALFFSNPSETQFINYFIEYAKKVPDSREVVKEIIEDSTSSKFISRILEKMWDRILPDKDKQLLEILDKQRSTFIQFLLQTSIGVAFFWRNREPTFHIVIPHGVFTQDQLLNLATIPYKGIGKVVPFHELVKTRRVVKAD